MIELSNDALVDYQLIKLIDNMLFVSPFQWPFELFFEHAGWRGVYRPMRPEQMTLFG